MMRARKLLPILLLLGGGGLMCGVAPALAAPPETPLTRAATINGPTAATLQGEVFLTRLGASGNGEELEGIEYHFAYGAGVTLGSKGEVLCPGAGAQSAPEPAAKIAGGVPVGQYEKGLHEYNPVVVPVTGLQPETQYTVCLVATSLSGESTAGAPVTFTTPATTLVTRYPLLRFEREFGQEFEKPVGMAVDQANGNVFVLDKQAPPIVYVSNGTGGSPVAGFPAQLTGAETPAGSFHSAELGGVAVYDAGGQFSLYVTDELDNVVDKFTLNAAHQYEYVCEFVGAGAPCVKRPGEAAPSEAFRLPSAVAVDSQGNVYIASETGRGAVDKFNAAGEYVWGVSHAQHPLITGQPVGVAADTAGDVYLVVEKPDESSQRFGYDTVKLVVGPEGAVHGEAVFAPEGPQVEPVPGKKVPSSTSVGVTVEQSSGDVLVYQRRVELLGDFFRYFVQERNSAGGVLSEYATATLGGGELTPQGSGALEPDDSLFQAGVAVREDEAANDVYAAYDELVTSSPSPGKAYIEMFGPLPPTLKVSTQAPSEAHGSGATLNGVVDPKGVKLVECEFEYGASSAYGHVVSCEQGLGEAPGEIGKGTVPVAVTAKLTGLTPNAVYHYQLVAKSENGFEGEGGDGTVAVAVRPTVDDVPPAAVLTRTTALLSGTLDPENSPTSYHFVYVDEGGYQPGAANPYATGSETPAAAAGSALLDETLAPQTLTGLTAGTTYHYALVATNAAGTSVGSDHTFTTAAPTPPLVATGAVSEVTQTTATISGTVDPEGIQTSYEFDLGTDTSYGGARVFANAGQSAGPQTISLALVDLTPGTTYHYRIAATNQDGTSYGADRTFTTAAVSSPIAQPLAEPLIAAPLIAFPTETSTVVKPPVKKKAKAKAKHRKKTRRKQKRAKKTNRRGGAGR